MITVDGSMGGGSVVRLAVGLAAATESAVRVKNVRAERDNTGLRHQHVAGVRAVKELTNAETEGLELGSTELVFDPGPVVTDSVTVDIPTAGSVALTLQPLMLAATATDRPVTFRVEGGATAGKWAPTIHYMQQVTLPILAEYGYHGSIEVERHGFYPEGGAVVEATFNGGDLDWIECTERSPVEAIRGVSWASSDLSGNSVAERQRMAARETLLQQLTASADVDIDTAYVDTACTGSAVQLWADSPETRIGGSALGEQGVDAKTVGEEAGQALSYAMMVEGPLDEYMSDQIIPFLGLAGGTVRVRDFTDHVATNIAVTKAFTVYGLELDRPTNRVSVT